VIAKRHRLFSDSNESSRILSNCSSTSRQHKLSGKILSKSLSLFSDRWLPKVIACLAIDCRKIASKDLAIGHSQITSDYLASFDRQNVIAYLAIKERQIAESI
jgi:hypothetical protein